MARDRISIVGAGLTSLQQLPDLANQTAEIRVLCLHGNRIADLEGIQHLQYLTDVNLSSNTLHSVQGLQTLTALTSINLASNRLQSLDGLQSLPALQRLVVSHNFIPSLARFAPQTANRPALRSVDLHNNLLASVEDLLPLRHFVNLKDLTIHGGHPGNTLCDVPNYQRLTAQMLPQLETLDGLKVEAIRAQAWAQPHQQQTQHQHHRHQSMQPGTLLAHPTSMLHQPLALPPPPSAMAIPSNTLAAVHQPQPSSRPSGAGATGTYTELVRAPMLDPHQRGSQEDRIAALEARLDVLNARRRPPLAPTENLPNQPPPLALAHQARKIRPKAVMHEVACQTATDKRQLDSLQHDAAHLKQELQSLVSELDQRTAHALRVEEQAEALVREAEEQARHKVCCILVTSKTVHAFCCANYDVCFLRSPKIPRRYCYIRHTKVSDVFVKGGLLCAGSPDMHLCSPCNKSVATLLQRRSCGTHNLQTAADYGHPTSGQWRPSASTG